MTTVKALLTWDPSRKNNIFLVDNVNKSEDILLRLPTEWFPDGLKFVTVEINVDVSEEEVRCITFLREAVRRNPDARLSGNDLWAAWADWNGVPSSLKTITGIDRKDIHDYFRVAFDEDEMSWKRLDGKPQWVWMGYELVSKGDDRAPGDDSAMGED